MTLTEIRLIVKDIITDIEKNQGNYTYRKYETFFDRIGMLNRRNFEILTKFERQFKNNHITFGIGNEKFKHLSDFTKGTTITFRQELMEKTENISEKTEKVKFAGKVNISNSESGITPYEHQEKAFYNLQKQIVKTNKTPFAGLLVLPTGGGKTLTAAMWIAKNYLDKGKKVLWVAHRHELLEQAKSTFSDKLAYRDIFANKSHFNYRIISGIHDKPINIKETDDLIISSKDSLNAGFNHLNRLWIDGKTVEIFLVIDEAHHATAKTYRKLIQNVKNSVSTFRLLGLTATPTRTALNEQGLLQKVFPDDIIYKIDLRSLIRLGILSEPIFEDVQTGQNFIKDLTDKQIEEVNKFDINSIGEGIAETIANNKDRNHLIVSKYVLNKDKYKQTIVFALNVDNAIALKKLFQNQGIKSEYVISNVKDAVTGVTSNFTKENKEKIDNFRNGNLEVLINVNILTEGTDVPNVQSIFLTRPTISTVLMTQMIGRGLRGLRAGGTKDAYIVSFIDEWQDKIAWVNPEKLFIEENIDFNDVDKETKKQLIRLVSINKIEEFAILTNQIIEPEIKEELEKLDFIQRFPKGIYQFRYLEQTEDEPKEINCEVLVYDNIEESYKEFLKALPGFFNYHKLNDRDSLTEKELDILSSEVENEFFKGTDKYPAYRLQDIRDIIQYYAIQDEIPPYIELNERENYNIDRIAQEIYDKDFGARAEKELIDSIWESEEIAWQTFFNFDKRHLIREINLAKTKISHPDLYQRAQIKPVEEHELRKYENMNLYQIREVNPVYEKWLRDEVFKKFTDKDGFYFSPESGFKSKNRLIFQVDHIKPMHNGGLTVLENLQILTRGENALKGNK